MTRDHLTPVVSVLILSAGLAIGKAYDWMTVRHAFAATALVALMMVVHIAVAAAYEGKKHVGEIDGIISKLQNLVDIGYPEWLYTSKTLAPFEAATPFKDVWVVSPDLSNDVFGPAHDIPRVVRKNAKRGVRYTFLVPKKDELVPELTALRKQFESTPDMLRVIEISADEWDRSFLAHVMVLNPASADGKRPDVFLELPLKERGHGKAHWIRVGEDAASKVVGRLTKLGLLAS